MMNWYIYIIHQCSIDNYVNECGPRSTFRVKVAWLQVSDVMLPLVKNIYLIDQNHVVQGQSKTKTISSKTKPYISRPRPADKAKAKSANALI